MAIDSGMDLLSELTLLMRQSLQKSQTITDSVVSILGSFDSRLSTLETAMRPTQIRTHAIRKAHENINKTLKVAEAILSQFDLLRQALECLVRLASVRHSLFTSGTTRSNFLAHLMTGTREILQT